MTRRFPLPASRRIVLKRDYHRLRSHGRVCGEGPLRYVTTPNGLAWSRIGLAVPRAVGTAPRRNLIRRRLREAFRLLQHELPTGFDLLIIVRPHPPRTLERYQAAMTSAMSALLPPPEAMS